MMPMNARKDVSTSAMASGRWRVSEVVFWVLVLACPLLFPSRYLIMTDILRLALEQRIDHRNRLGLGHVAPEAIAMPDLAALDPHAGPADCRLAQVERLAAAPCPPAHHDQPGLGPPQGLVLRLVAPAVPKFGQDARRRGGQYGQSLLATKDFG